MRVKDSGTPDLSRGESAPSAAHTPGPWALNAADKREVVAESECMVICRTPGDLYQKRASANTRLIASAPALLEALKEIRDEIEQSNGGKGPTLPITKHILGIARAAISSAERR